MIYGNFTQIYRPASPKQIAYIKDLIRNIKYKEPIDFMHLSMREAGKLIYKLKNIK